MPYTQNAELPKAVKDNLPSHAQSIWRKAFNSAEKRYNEERAFKIAWAAVKNAGYKKNGEDKWVKESLEIRLSKNAVSWVNESSFFEGKINKSDLDEQNIKISIDNLDNYSIKDVRFILSEITEKDDSFNIHALVLNGLNLPDSFQTELVLGS